MSFWGNRYISDIPKAPPTGRLFLFRPMRQIHPINIQFNCGVNHFVFILYFYLNSTSIAISWSTTKEPQGKWVQMFRAPFLYLPGAPNSPNPPLPWTSGSERVRGSGTRHTFSSTRRKEPPMEEGVLSENHWPRQVPTLSQHDHTHLNPNHAHLVHKFVHTMQCYFTFDSWKALQCMLYLFSIAFIWVRNERCNNGS